MDKRTYRKLFKVPFWVPVFDGLVEGYSMINIKPCPTCKRNDKASNIREGWCIFQIHCDRCGLDFWA